LPLHQLHRYCPSIRYFQPVVIFTEKQTFKHIIKFR
jgi:hypothetical protein